MVFLGVRFFLCPLQSLYRLIGSLRAFGSHIQASSPFPGLILALTLFGIVTLAILSAGCAAAADPGPVRIGVLLPANGSLATHSLDGLTWAVNEMNRHGGLDGRAIEVVYRDTSAGDISAYAEELAGRDDIEVVIGPATSAELGEIAPIVTGQGKLLISPSVTTGLVTAEFKENNLFWRTCPADGRQVEAVFRILREDGVETVSLVTAKTPYGETFARLAPAAAAMNGIRIAGAVSVGASENFTGIAAQVGEEEPEAVVAAVSPEEAIDLYDALSAASSSAALFLTDAGRSPYLLANLGERAEGIRGTSLSPDPSTGYAVAYEEVFGETPPPFAAQTYDALLLAVYTAAR
ncbi:MAG: ABC transporter substrate-binding protein, partial [Methanosarcinaceae archaeon]|nr:ABC transporter substrate-binding protein [Methanosarcinaceae archaeon]